MQNESIAPVEKSVEVPIAPANAFALFTAGIAKWWPLASHSVGGDRAETVVFEAHAGGRIYERTSDGELHDWGDVLEFAPDERVVFTWFPGRARDTAQRVAVSFAPSGTGTRIDLIHTGWELLGDAADETRAGYDIGWDFVLGERYASATG